MKQILVPTDFSKNATHAFRYALELAKREKTSLLLLHAYYIYPVNEFPLPYSDEIMHSIRVDAEERLQKLCIQAQSAHVSCSMMCEEGFPTDVILDAARSEKVSLIVMGNKGSSDSELHLLGSHTSQVLQRATCPVLAVPAQARFSEPHHIAYATDYHNSDLNAISALKEFLRVFKGDIELVHVSAADKKDRAPKELLEKFCDLVKRKVPGKKVGHELMYAPDVEKGLEQYINKKHPDILALSVRHRNFIDRILEGGTTRRMLDYSQVPLMVFHHRENPSTIFFSI